MRKVLFFFIPLSFVFSCSEKEKIPKDILPQAKMQAVLWDMISAGEFLNGYVLKDTTDKEAESSKIYGQVLQVNHISREEFDKSYLYYRQHPALMKVILDSMSSKRTKPVPLQENDSLQRTDSLHRVDSVHRGDSLHKADSIHRSDSLQRIDSLHRKKNLPEKINPVLPIQKNDSLSRKKLKRKKPKRVLPKPILIKDS